MTLHIHVSFWQPVHKIWWFYNCIMVFPVFVIGFFIVYNIEKLCLIISYISVSVSTSSLIFVFFQHVCKVNPGAEIKLARSSLHISSQLFVRLSNIFASNRVSLFIYRSLYWHTFWITKSSQTLSAWL